MGSMCKCVKKRENDSQALKDESDDNFEQNSKKIEDIMSKLNEMSLCHTGIWPDNYKYAIIDQEGNNFTHFKYMQTTNVKNTKNTKNEEIIFSKQTFLSNITYDLSIPLIRKDRYIFTAKEYFAAKKIMKFFKKLKA